jgi:glucose uptake protein
MNLSFLLWLTGAMVAFLSAATASRAYIASSNILLLILSLGLYCIGNLMMVKLMREGGLGLAISVSAVAQLVLINLIAFTVFGERPNTLQLTGVGLGVLAMVLMLIPLKAKS